MVLVKYLLPRANLKLEDFKSEIVVLFVWEHWRKSIFLRCFVYFGEEQSEKRIMLSEKDLYRRTF